MASAIAKLLILLALVGCVGCTPPPQQTFLKNGASVDDYRRDAYECERDTRQVAGSFGPGYVGLSNANGFAIRCMQSKGWSYGSFSNGYL